MLKVALAVNVAALAWCAGALFGLPACGPTELQAQALSADAIARIVNAAEDTLAASYRAEGDRCIDTAADKPAALACLAAHRSSWGPVWQATESFRVAHEAWIAALAADDPSGAAGMVSAYCALRLALRGRASLPDLPPGSGASCPEPTTDRKDSSP